MKLNDLRREFEHIRENALIGWDRLRQSTAGALTRFWPNAKTAMPGHGHLDKAVGSGEASWSMLSGDVFEDDRHLVVRVEAPGMRKEDFDVLLQGDTLIIRGDKRFSQESSEGRWRLIQCAYGSFQRVVPLPASVRLDDAKASYRNGVLRVELSKLRPGRPRSLSIDVA